MRMLYVEDNLVNLALMERITQSKGYDVLTSTTAEGALTILDNHDVDVIIIDIKLAGKMDGIQLTRQLRVDGYEGPIIVTTAYEAIYSEASAYDAGCSEFLTKPLSVRQIIALLADHNV